MENKSNPLDDASKSVENVEKISSSLMNFWKTWSWVAKWWKGEETTPGQAATEKPKRPIIILGAGGTG